MSSFGVLMLIFLAVLLYYHSDDMNRRFDELEKRLPRPDALVGAETETETETKRRAAAWDRRVAEELAAKERTERNREVKRRAKARKAEGIAEQRRERGLRDLAMVAESLEYERKLRNQVAAEYAWPVHPNDVDWLDETERRAMYQAFGAREPFRQEWQNPEGS